MWLDLWLSSAGVSVEVMKLLGRENVVGDAGMNRLGQRKTGGLDGLGYGV